MFYVFAGGGREDAGGREGGPVTSRALHAGPVDVQVFRAEVSWHPRPLR